MRISTRRATVARLLAGTIGLIAASAAQAQDASASPADAQVQADATTEIAAPAVSEGDIIVTAQKRSQNVQDVPLAVQVVGVEQLQAASVREFSDLNRVAPSLVVRPAENPVNASVSIRGIGTFAFSIGVEPSVAVQVDDVPISFQARAFADLSDISRIEVLRGPQSTLYGKSASAGLINIVTPGPSDKLTVKVGAFGTTDSEYGGNVVVSGPIGNTLGFRSTANYDKFDGNVRNLFNGDKVNGRRIFSTRNKLVWDPTSTLNVTLGVDYIDGTTTIGRPFARLDPNALLRNTPGLTPAVHAPGVRAGLDNDDVVNNINSGTQYHDFAQSLRIVGDLGGPTLMLIASHDAFTLHDQLDQDESAVAAFDNRQTGTFKSTQFTQEIRLVSPGTDRFRYTLGLFYANVDYSRDFTRGPVYSQARWFATSKSDAYSAFGQLEFDILPQTTVIGGIRRGHEDIAYTFRDIRNGGAFFSGNAGDTYTTYKAGLQQKLGDDIMLFGTFATGHKGQSYDLGTGFNRNRALAGPVRPETSDDYEIGARTQFFDRRVTVNLTLFDTRYKNFQAQGIETFSDGSVNYRLTNVGRLKTRGIELETSARVFPGLTIGASGTYLDAAITEFPDAQCYPVAIGLSPGCVAGTGGRPASQNLAGKRPPQAPEWKLAGSFDFSHDLGSLPFQGLIQGSATYQSKINYSLNQDPETVQRGYTIVNLSAGIRDRDRGYELVAFVNNLFDKQYFSNITDSRGNYGGATATQSYLPRDFRRYAGVRASYSF
ncbi:iron complex outermembrane receptor protein [Sphingomonas sp. UYAg733]